MIETDAWKSVSVPSGCGKVPHQARSLGIERYHITYLSELTSSKSTKVAGDVDYTGGPACE